MANKPEKTLEQLKAEAELANQVYQLALKAEKQKKREEAEKKKAELAAIKEKRYQEVLDAENKFLELKTAYMKDYGAYSTTRTYAGGDAVDFMHWLLQ